MRIILAAIVLLCFFSAGAQGLYRGRHPLQIRSISAGARLFEVNSIGNNPRTLALMLKHPEPYLRFIDNISWNSLYGNPGIQVLYQYQVAAELYKNYRASRFWKRYSLQAGVFVSSKLQKSGMSIGNQGMLPDTTLFYDHFSITQHQRFAGALAGINRRIRLGRNIGFATGLHLAGSIAIHHRYYQQRDSNTFHYRRGWSYTTTPLGNLEGKNYLVWQAMLPLALEINIYRNRLFLRPEVFAGIIGGKYYKIFRRGPEEAHGAAMSLVYQY